MLRGKELKIMRIKSDYTATQVSRIVGVTKQYMSMIENDRKKPSKELYNKLIRLYENKEEQYATK